MQPPVAQILVIVAAWGAGLVLGKVLLHRLGRDTNTPRKSYRAQLAILGKHSNNFRPTACGFLPTFGCFLPTF